MTSQHQFSHLESILNLFSRVHNELRKLETKVVGQLLLRSSVGSNSFFLNFFQRWSEKAEDVYDNFKEGYMYVHVLSLLRGAPDQG